MYSPASIAEPSSHSNIEDMTPIRSVIILRCLQASYHHMCMSNTTSKLNLYHAYDTDSQGDMDDRIDTQLLQDPVVGSKDGQLHHAGDSDAQPHQHLTPTCNVHQTSKCLGCGHMQIVLYMVGKQKLLLGNALCTRDGEDDMLMFTSMPA